uniref:Protein kinase domain-containing protein n=1 Tax=Timema douglasi TaxID=61478 RepID=A0A7R8ZAQ5_TIMDO|nr:unnamed protein product [Timema douglasi]
MVMRTINLVMIVTGGYGKSKTGGDGNSKAECAGNYKAGGDSNYKAGSDSNYKADGDEDYKSGGDSNYKAEGDGNYKAGSDGNYTAGSDGKYKADGDENYKTGGDGNYKSGSDISYKAGSDGKYKADGDENYKAGSDNNYKAAEDDGNYKAGGDGNYKGGSSDDNYKADGDENYKSASDISYKAGSDGKYKADGSENYKAGVDEEFDILQIVGEGWFGKILLAEHRATDTEMVLKALPKPYVALRDFYREFHYGLHLGAHRNVITTYDVAFETAGFYVFSQEYAPLGDLTSNVSETGIGELHSKRVAKQVRQGRLLSSRGNRANCPSFLVIPGSVELNTTSALANYAIKLASALEHLHMRDLVHRDVKLDNILVFKSDFSRIKLCDFGETRREGTLVRRRNEWLPYSPPEVMLTNTDETYKAVTSHDVWQFGIVIFVCLTGCLPWQKASSDDPRYTRYLYWHNSTGVLMPVRRPKLFKLLTSKAQRLFRKLLEPKTEKRPAGLADLNKFLDDRWLTRTSLDRNTAPGGEDDGLCPSMYSFHSSLEEKNKLLFTLTQYGIETTVDRSAKKDRIRDWIQSSVIDEEEEDEEGNEEDEEKREREELEERRNRNRHGKVTVSSTPANTGSNSRSASQ